MSVPVVVAVGATGAFLLGAGLYVLLCVLTGEDVNYDWDI